MSIDRTSSRTPDSVEDFQIVSKKDLDRDIKLYELNTNINNAIGTNFFTKAFNSIFKQRNKCDCCLYKRISENNFQFGINFSIFEIKF